MVRVVGQLRAMSNNPVAGCREPRVPRTRLTYVFRTGWGVYEPEREWPGGAADGPSLQIWTSNGTSSSVRLAMRLTAAGGQNCTVRMLQNASKLMLAVDPAGLHSKSSCTRHAARRRRPNQRGSATAPLQSLTSTNASAKTLTTASATATWTALARALTSPPAVAALARAEAVAICWSSAEADAMLIARALRLQQ